MKALSQWRTVITVVVLGGLLVACLALCRGMPPEFGADVFATAAYALLGLAFAQAGKSSVEHLGKGGGVKGAVAALLTEAKPGEPQSPTEKVP